MSHPARAALPLVVAIALASGCGEAEAQDPVAVITPCGSVDEGAWESAPFLPEASCPWIEYRADTSYRIPHALGARPRSYEAYVAFSEDGRGAAPAAGDMAVLVELSDADIVLRNRTGETFFLRLVLR